MHGARQGAGRITLRTGTAEDWRAGSGFPSATNGQAGHFRAEVLPRIFDPFNTTKDDRAPGNRPGAVRWPYGNRAAARWPVSKFGFPSLGPRQQPFPGRKAGGATSTAAIFRMHHEKKPCLHAAWAPGDAMGLRPPRRGTNDQDSAHFRCIMDPGRRRGWGRQSCSTIRAVRPTTGSRVCQLAMGPEARRRVFLNPASLHSPVPRAAPERASILGRSVAECGRTQLPAGLGKRAPRRHVAKENRSRKLVEEPGV